MGGELHIVVEEETDNQNLLAQVALLHWRSFERSKAGDAS